MFCMICGGPSPCEAHTFRGYLDAPRAKHLINNIELTFGCAANRIPVCEIRQITPDTFSAIISFIPNTTNYSRYIQRDHFLYSEELIMNLKTFQTLRRLMQQTTSDNDHEALAALRKANALLREDNVTWDKFFSRTVTVVNDFEAGVDDSDYPGVSIREASRIDAAFEVLERKSLRNEAEDFIASLHEQWLTRRSLSEKQQEALFKFARNAEEGRR